LPTLQDDDGFYTGELWGQFGLVPPNRLEEKVKMATPSPSPPPRQLLTSASARDTELTERCSLMVMTIVDSILSVLD